MDIDPKRFTKNGNYAEIEFEQAMKQNEMAVVGDYSIGTVYPLILRLQASLNKPREISAEGRVSMTIGSWQILGDTLLEHRTEQNIAF